MHVLRNGVDLTLFLLANGETARRALGLTRPILLAVLNLVGVKRHRLMVEALAGLPEFDLIIVGEELERAAIGALARELGLADRSRLLGRGLPDRLADIYTAADLLLLVSTSEGWLNVLLESMACGTAIIVSDIDDIADIVAAPEAGCILPETTPSRIADAVRAFFAAPPDRVATRACGECFDWWSTTEGWSGCFTRHAAAGSSGALWRQMPSAPIHSGDPVAPCSFVPGADPGTHGNGRGCCGPWMAGSSRSSQVKPGHERMTESSVWVGTLAVPNGGGSD